MLGVMINVLQARCRRPASYTQMFAFLAVIAILVWRRRARASRCAASKRAWRVAASRVAGRT